MGYSTREISSTALSNLYPTLYFELQIYNWSPVDIIVTKSNGQQYEVPKLRHNSPRQYVAIENLESNGMRSQEERGRIVGVPINGKEHIIDYENFVFEPFRLDELGLIISTKEQRIIAQAMALDDLYSPDKSEALSDFETVDPRFIFEVNDPFNRWEELYLNILGQTVRLRCGHSNQLIEDLDEKDVDELSERCELSCYLRYPSNFVQDDSATVPVFTINLKDLDLEEPYVIPSGDVICIASSEDALQRVMAKRRSGETAQIQIAGMISQEHHERVVKDLKTQNEEDKRISAESLKIAKLQSASEIAALKASLEAEKREHDSTKQQLKYWHDLHESSISRYEREDKLISAREKMRQEAYDASRKASEDTVTFLKIAGTAAAGLLSFAMAFMLKSKK